MPIFRGAYLQLIQNLASLKPEKLQGFHGTPLYHFTQYSVYEEGWEYVMAEFIYKIQQ